MKSSGLFILLMLSAIVSLAQKHKKEPEEGTYPRVWVGNIRSYYTCRDSILAKPMLVTDSVGCKVSGFTISLMAPGHDFYGPIHANGNEFTEQQKDLVKTWNYKEVTFYVQDIHLNCHETDAVAHPFQLRFDR